MDSYFGVKQEWQSPFIAPANSQDVFQHLRSPLVKFGELIIRRNPAGLAELPLPQRLSPPGMHCLPHLVL